MTEQNQIARLLDEEYKETLSAVSYAQTGSDEAKWQLEKLSALHKQRMDEMKTDRENKDGRKDRVIKIVMDGLAILLPLGVSSYWMAKGMTFEEKGTYTSRTLQWVNNHFKFFRK